MTVAFLATLASAAAAQHANDRRGVWLGAGVGVGPAEATCSVCLARETGLAAHARVGGTMSRNVLVGVEGTGWLKRDAQADRSFLIVAAMGIFYPSRNYGLHVKGGVGQYWYVQEDAASRVSTQGLALELGAGFDVRIVPGLSLTPFATLVTSGFGNPTRLDKASGVRLPLFSEMSVQFFQFGLAATLH